MTVQHSALTGAELHEPKGIDAAAADQVYVSNGSGSGAWTTYNNANMVVLNVHHDDLSSATSHYIVTPIAGRVTAIYSVIDRSINGSDTVLDFKIGGVSMTGGSITITQSGSAAGDVDSSNPTANNVLTAGQAIEVASDGGTSTGSAHAHISIMVDVS